MGLSTQASSVPALFLGGDHDGQLYRCVSLQQCVAYSLEPEYTYGTACSQPLGAGESCLIQCSPDWAQIGADGYASCPETNVDPRTAQQNVFPYCAPKQNCVFLQTVFVATGREPYSITSEDCADDLNVSQSSNEVSVGLQVSTNQQCTLIVECPDGYGTTVPGGHLENRVVIRPICAADKYRRNPNVVS